VIGVNHENFHPVRDFDYTQNCYKVVFFCFVNLLYYCGIVCIFLVFTGWRVKMGKISTEMVILSDRLALLKSVFSKTLFIQRSNQRINVDRFRP
jgi:hypothetical protein